MPLQRASIAFAYCGFLPPANCGTHVMNTCMCVYTRERRFYTHTLVCVHRTLLSLWKRMRERERKKKVRATKDWFVEHMAYIQYQALLGMFQTRCGVKQLKIKRCVNIFRERCLVLSRTCDTEAIFFFSCMRIARPAYFKTSRAGLTIKFCFYEFQILTTWLICFWLMSTSDARILREGFFTALKALRS